MHEECHEPFASVSQICARPTSDLATIAAEELLEVVPLNGPALNSKKACSFSKSCDVPLRYKQELLQIGHHVRACT